VRGVEREIGADEVHAAFNDRRRGLRSSISVFGGQSGIVIAARAFYVIVIAPFVLSAALDPLTARFLDDWAQLGRADYRVLISGLTWSRRLAVPITVMLAFVVPPLLTLTAARFVRIPSSGAGQGALRWFLLFVASWLGGAVLILALRGESGVPIACFWSGAAAQSIVVAHAYRIQLTHVQAGRARFSATALPWVAAGLQSEWIWPGFLVAVVPMLYGGLSWRDSQ